LYINTYSSFFLEDIYDHLANNSPICTLFVDYKSAFDMLWYEGYVGRLRRIDISIGLTIENRS